MLTGRRLGLLAGIVASAVTSQAALVNLSLFSSDETPASALSATLNFTVVSSALTLEVTNTSSEFTINEIYFNDTDHITGLSLANTPGWSMEPMNAADPNMTTADGFGMFDFALMSDVPSGPGSKSIKPGDSRTFTFTISGDPPFVDTDFTTQLSSVPPGMQKAFVAAKFVNGPGDDSAFGAVPEPTTLAGLALLGAFALRRRR